MKKVKVSYSTAQTINLGNYESVKVQVGLEMECEEEDINVTYKRVKNFVDKKIEKETKKWKM